MAEVRIAPRAAGREAETTRRATERFLSRPRGAAIGVFLLFAATFDEGLVHEDGLIYFDFLRRFFGADAPGVAYQFGSAVWNAPFYLAAQLVASLAAFDHYHSGEIAIA